MEAPDIGEGNSNEPQRSCDLDDDNDNLPFSQEIRNAPMLNHFTLPKIPKYNGKGDPAKHLKNFKTHMGLRGTTPTMKCRAFHLSLSSAAEVWYTRLGPGSIWSWPDFKKAFF